MSVINSDVLVANNLARSSERTSHDESNERHKTESLIQRDQYEDPYVLNLSPSKLTYMNKETADVLLDDPRYAKLYTAEKGYDATLNLTNDEMMLKVHDPEIFLFHILIKKMGKSKAAKTTEENARKVLERILSQVPTNLKTVKYTRKHSIGS